MTQDNDQTRPSSKNGLGCALVLAALLAYFSVECIWKNQASSDVRKRHAAAGHHEIIAGRSGEIHNPISWFYAWPHCIWFHDPVAQPVKGKTATFTVWLMASDDDPGGERPVIARINPDGGGIQTRQGDKWFALQNDGELHDGLLSILSR